MDKEREMGTLHGSGICGPDGAWPGLPLPPPVLMGGSVVRALARDREVASSTPGLSATK